MESIRGFGACAAADKHKLHGESVFDVRRHVYQVFERPPERNRGTEQVAGLNPQRKAKYERHNGLEKRASKRCQHGLSKNAKNDVPCLVNGQVQVVQELCNPRFITTCDCLQGKESHRHEQHDSRSKEVFAAKRSRQQKELHPDGPFFGIVQPFQDSSEQRLLFVRDKGHKNNDSNLCDKMRRDYNEMRRRSLFAVNFRRLAIESAVREAVPEIRIFKNALFEPLVELRVHHARIRQGCDF